MFYSFILCEAKQDKYSQKNFILLQSLDLLRKKIYKNLKKLKTQLKVTRNVRLGVFMCLYYVLLVYRRCLIPMLKKHTLVLNRIS